jgi:tetratricopeptide (TPR) repeat protein
MKKALLSFCIVFCHLTVSTSWASGYELPEPPSKEIMDLLREAHKYNITYPSPYGVPEKPDREKALGLYQQALERMEKDIPNYTQHPQWLVTCFRVATLYDYQNKRKGVLPDLDKAIEYYNKVIEAKPWSMPTYYWAIDECSDDYLRLGKYHEGLETARKAFEFHIDEIEKEWWRYMPDRSENPEDPRSFEGSRAKTIEYQKANVTNIVRACNYMDRTCTLAIVELGKILEKNPSPEISEYARARLDRISRIITLRAEEESHLVKDIAAGQTPSTKQPPGQSTSTSDLPGASRGEANTVEFAEPTQPRPFASYWVLLLAGVSIAVVAVIYAVKRK